jgi:hypothetical protein
LTSGRIAGAGLLLLALAGCRDTFSAGKVSSHQPAAPADGGGHAPNFTFAPEAGAGPDDAGVDEELGAAGRSFYPVLTTQVVPGACFALFVVNPGNQPTQLTLTHGSTALPLGKAARLPHGSGRNLTWLPLSDGAAGAPGSVIPPHEVAVVFVAQDPGQVFAPCPPVVVPALRAAAHLSLGLADGAPKSGLGDAFHLTSDHPVIAYQVYPYGGGSSAVTSATLLWPEEAWGTGYVAVHPIQNATDGFVPRTIAVVAAQDDTTITIRPTADVAAAPGVAAIGRGALGTIKLHAGQYVELGHSTAELTGSVITASKPVGLYGGAPCLYMPDKKDCCCDSAQQQIPPVSALGSEYAAVRYRSRTPDGAPEEANPWRLVGIVDGTKLTYLPAPPPGAPTTLSRGQFVEVTTADPFVVRSQDGDHPFYLAEYMTGGDPFEGAGDPEFVNVLATAQYLPKYVFFTDPTYPETSLVVVRQHGADGKFADVTLECSGMPLSGWQAVGDFEYTRVSLVTGNWEPALAGCDNGRQSMSSTAPFGVTVWGWGTKATGAGNAYSLGYIRPLPDWYTRYASYAYPAGGNTGRVNDVVVIP